MPGTGAGAGTTVGHPSYDELAALVIVPFNPSSSRSLKSVRS